MRHDNHPKGKRTAQEQWERSMLQELDGVGCGGGGEDDDDVHGYFFVLYFGLVQTSPP